MDGGDGAERDGTAAAGDDDEEVEEYGADYVGGDGGDEKRVR